MTKFTLKDVLDIKHPGKWRWSPDGKSIAFIWDDGGLFDLFLLDVCSGSQQQISNAKDAVTDFEFNPKDGTLAFIQDGVVYRFDPRKGEPAAVWLSAHEPATCLGWSPCGGMLGFVSGGKLAIYTLATGSLVDLKVPGHVTPGGLEVHGAFGWSQDSKLVCFSFADAKKERHIGVSDLRGNMVFRTHDADPSMSPVFVDKNTVYFGRMRERGTLADCYLLHLETDCCGTLKAAEPELIYSIPGDGLGNLLSCAATPSPAGDKMLFLLENDGWAHIHMYDRKAKQMKQLVFGEHEDFAHAGDAPQWSPCGTKVLFSSSKGDIHERHLWVIDVETGDMKQMDSLPGNNSVAMWSPDGSRIGFMHCDVAKSLDLWVMDVAKPEQARQLTFSMPEVWCEQNVSPAEHVVYKGALGWDINGFLYKPKDFDPKKKYRAIVWVHGGPIRQMRPYFHPLQSYAVFHAYHQYLIGKGFVSFWINFRGGTGYGRKFRMGLYKKMGIDDVVDVVEAGRYLKSLPYVDETKVAVGGLSYGGYMTLHSLTQFPDEFCMGVNLAGIWDFAQWTRWIQSRRGSQGGSFVNFFAGFPEENPHTYEVGSPYTYAKNLKRPLINLHGTADANVDFEQLDRIVLDCVKYGKNYEAYYYPKELHMFRWRSTWEDAFPKIEREFDKYM